MVRPVLMLALAFPLAAQFRDWPPMPDAAMRLLLAGDPQASRDALRVSADAGDAIALFWLGRSWEEGVGLPHDYPRAMDSYRKASERGIGVAAWSLGRIYDMGRGASIDPAEAQKWYARSAALGFRRTALAVVKLRWYPSPADLQYEPAPDSVRNRPPSPSPDMAYLDRLSPPDLSADEIDTLRKAGIRGRLVWQGGEPGLFGLPARLVLIARRPVLEEVRLTAPFEGSLLYLQRDREWQRLGSGKTSGRTIRIYPQSPDMPWTTQVMIESEDGGWSGGSGWGWERP